MSEQVFYSPSHTVSDGSITVGTVNVTNTIGKPGAFYYKTVWNPKYLSYKTTLQPAGEPGYITNVKVGPQGSNMYVRVLYDGGASGNGVPNNKTAYSETQWTYLGTPYTWKNSPYGSGNVQYKIGPTIPGATRTIDFYSTDPVDIS